MAGALAAVGTARFSPTRCRLRDVASLYRLGAGRGAHGPMCRPNWRRWASCWSRPGVRFDGGPGVAVAGRGQPVGRRAQTEVAVRRAGIWVLAPLGVCFLPAFLCLGVVPLVLGIAGDVFG